MFICITQWGCMVKCSDKSFCGSLIRYFIENLVMPSYSEDFCLQDETKKESTYSKAAENINN